jgi:pimeloyl-ACP methyl ester carboxylesterase
VGHETRFPGESSYTDGQLVNETDKGGPMACHFSGTVRLKDGRALGYAEYGDPNGTPLLHFHSFPSCRFEPEMPGVTDAARDAHARLIVVERPGFGLSDLQPRRRILDWPDDISQFADQLALDCFVVLGLSGGGPYAAACAWKLPERVLAAGIVSGISPLDLPDALDGMRPPVRLIFALARQTPGLVPAAAWAMMQMLVHPETDVYPRIDGDEPEPDRLARLRPGVQEAFHRMQAGAFARGWQGAALDLQLLGSPWGFPPQEIRIPVLIWHGALDNAVPVSHAKRLARQIGGSALCIHADEGHHSLAMNRAGEVLTALLTRALAEAKARRPSMVVSPTETVTEGSVL